MGYVSVGTMCLFLMCGTLGFLPSTKSQDRRCGKIRSSSPPLSIQRVCGKCGIQEICVQKQRKIFSLKKTP